MCPHASTVPGNQQRGRTDVNGALPLFSLRGGPAGDLGVQEESRCHGASSWLWGCQGNPGSSLLSTGCPCSVPRTPPPHARGTTELQDPPQPRAQLEASPVTSSDDSVVQWLRHGGAATVTSIRTVSPGCPSRWGFIPKALGSLDLLSLNRTPRCYFP